MGERMASRSPFEIKLSAGQRAALEAIARTYTNSHRDVLRAKIVLYAAEGLQNKDIAARLDTSPQVVHKWRKRFCEQGLQGLEERSRSGRPPVFPPLGRARGQSARL
jgi:transposase-like protein